MSETLHSLAEWQGKSGVYIVSPFFDPDSPETPALVKVGLSVATDPPKYDSAIYEPAYGGLGSRLDSYLLCWPAGFHVYAVLQTKKTDASDLERLFHEYYTTKNFKTQHPHSRTEEWFYLTWNDVKHVVDGQRNNGKVHKITRENQPFYIDSNDRVSRRQVGPMTLERKQEFERSLPQVPPSADKRTVQPAKRPRSNAVQHGPLSTASAQPPPHFPLAQATQPADTHLPWGGGVEGGSLVKPARGLRNTPGWTRGPAYSTIPKKDSPPGYTALAVSLRERKDLHGLPAACRIRVTKGCPSVQLLVPRRHTAQARQHLARQGYQELVGALGGSM